MRNERVERPDDAVPNGWHAITVALVGGLAAASALFFLIAAVQTPGLDPPPETAALFVVLTTAATISYLLLRQHSTAGYPAAMLAGGGVLVTIGLVVAGAYGPAGPRTNPVGPAAYVALAVAVIVVAGVAWRRNATTAFTSGQSTT